MKAGFVTGMVLTIGVSLSAQTKVQWVSSTQHEQWKEISGLKYQSAADRKSDIAIDTDRKLQAMEGFGACFNELGWTSLSLLPDKDREAVMSELFEPGKGACFTICRMPVGANDFSCDWYSYNETAGDFEMKHFSIGNDLKTLVPFIKSAQKYNPALKLWASPWSSPAWMKKNGHYAMQPFQAGSPRSNGLKPGQEGREGTDMFIQEEKYFKAYALYFSRFIDEYRKQGIRIGMVMPQNEFNSAQVFPSCTWTAAGLARFIPYLGAEMSKQDVEIYFGTMERPNEKLVDTVLNDPQSKQFVKGVGFQWAGRGAIAGIHTRYPGLTLYQSEQECGDGRNDWKHCLHAWELMKHYIMNGTSAYMYWNISLKQGGISTWGWEQNSLVSVDTVKRTYAYTYEYYLMKHLSHFVKPGARLLQTGGTCSDLLAFCNPDNSVAVLVRNGSSKDTAFTVRCGKTIIQPLLAADSFNTFLFKNE